MVVVGFGLISIPGFRWVCPRPVKDLLEGWSCSTTRKKVKKLWMTASLCLLWAIWREEYDSF